MSLNSRVVLSKDTAFREVVGEAVILDLRSGLYFGLDSVGTRIWQLLEEDGYLRHVFDVMKHEYDVDSRQLERDLIRFVSQLVERGMGEVT
jgi:hypothetical protein